MKNDFFYLTHLGKLATFKNFLCSNYYQTVWCDYSSDLDIWIAYVNNSKNQEIIILEEQIGYLLLNFSKKDIMDFINNLGKAGGLFFNKEDEAFEWLVSLKEFLKNNNKI